MTPPPRGVAFSVTGRIEGVPVPMVLVYDADQPLMVTLRCAPDGSRDWSIARAAFTEAMAFHPLEETAASDVLVRRSAVGANDLFQITLMPHRSDRATIIMTADSVRRFLRLSHALVPIGADNESAAIDWSAAEGALGLEPGQLTKPHDPNQRREAS